MSETKEPPDEKELTRKESKEALPPISTTFDQRLGGGKRPFGLTVPVRGVVKLTAIGHEIGSP